MGSGTSKPKSNDKTEHKVHAEKKPKPTTDDKQTSEPNVDITQDTQEDDDAIVSKVPKIDEDKGLVVESEISYAEFPTHETLRKANEKYKKNHKNPPKNKDGTLQPYPSFRRKQDIFNKQKFEKLDKNADEAPESLLQQTVQEVVTFLTKTCKTQLEKARVCFRWLTSRNLNTLPTGEVPENAMLTALVDIKNNKNYGRYTDIYIEMCKSAGLQVQEIKGKVRTKCELDMVNEVDNIINTWVGVVIDNEWRLIDVQFAAVKVSGGGAGEWQLVDDTNKSKGKPKDTTESTIYECDEYYFLTDPEEFIYNHRPLEDAWQLLARPVTFSEFQQMAFLRPAFFQQSLIIGEYSKYIVTAFDGEQEIEFCVPKAGKYRFLYNLWKSTKGGKKSEALAGYQLSQFVMLHQKDSSLNCKVIFPESGDYKLDIFGSKVSEGGDMDQLCTYIIKVDAPKENWTAYPTNTRSEWGVTYEMESLGLKPVTHKDAIIELDDGNLDMRFQCEKELVDCQVTLRNNKNTNKEALQQCILFRQNENKQMVIQGKLPEAGLYALDIQGREMGSDDKNFPVIASYLIASSAGSVDSTKFPKIHRQLAGQTEENLKLKLTPTKYTESYIDHKDGEELKLEFKTPTAVSGKGTLMYHTDDNKQQDKSDYVLRVQEKESLTFNLRFVSAGVYSFQIFAKPTEAKGGFPHVYTYVINARQPSNETRPFPKAYDKWGAGCKSNITDGHLEDDMEKEFKITVPGAEDVAVITADDKWTHLTKGANNEFTGKVNTGPAGQLSVYAQHEGKENHSALLDYEVKPVKQLKLEEEKRRQKEAEAKAKEEQKMKEQEENKKLIEQELEQTRKELIAATESRDEELLKKAISKAEKKNFTSRLEKEYTKAKTLKKSLDRIGHLRKMILTMDQKTMAVIRSYKNPPALVHVVMRAAFLVLGNTLKETKEWTRCQALCNSIELNKRIRAFDVKKVTKDTAKKANNLLAPIRLEEIETISSGATLFYLWTVGMSEEIMDPK